MCSFPNFSLSWTDCEQTCPCTGHFDLIYAVFGLQHTVSERSCPRTRITLGSQVTADVLTSKQASLVVDLAPTILNHSYVVFLIFQACRGSACLSACSSQCLGRSALKLVYFETILILSGDRRSLNNLRDSALCCLSMGHRQGDIQGIC
jgi:hypothetical protein